MKYVIAFLIALVFLSVQATGIPEPKKYNFEISYIDGKGGLTVPLVITTIYGYGKNYINDGKELSETIKDYKEPSKFPEIYEAIKNDKRFVGVKLSVKIFPTKLKDTFEVEIEFYHSENSGFIVEKGTRIPEITEYKIKTVQMLSLNKPKDLKGLKKILVNKDLKENREIPFKVVLFER